MKDSKIIKYPSVSIGDKIGNFIISNILLVKF